MLWFTDTFIVSELIMYHETRPATSLISAPKYILIQQKLLDLKKRVLAMSFMVFYNKNKNNLSLGLTG